jgi:hypothetical protein
MIRRILTLLAALMMQACGGGSETTGPAGGDIPSVLVGTWGLAAAGTSQVCDDLGHCGPAYGGSESYQFSADGSFIYSQLLEVNLGGCSQTAFIYAIGHVTVSGAGMTVEPTSLRNRRSNTCGAASDQTYTDVDPSRYAWRVDPAAGLYLTGADSVEHGPYAPR